MPGSSVGQSMHDTQQAVCGLRHRHTGRRAGSPYASMPRVPQLVHAGLWLCQCAHGHAQATTASRTLIARQSALRIGILITAVHTVTRRRGRDFRRPRAARTAVIMPEGMRVAVDVGQEKAMLRGQVERLREHNKRMREKDTEMMEARRKAAEVEELVTKTKESWTHKLASERNDFETGRDDVVARIGRYEKKCAENAARLAALEAELKEVKAGTAAKPASTGGGAKAASQKTGAESLSAILARAGLSKYLATFQEEELDVALLRSMDSEEMVSNMAELGMSASEAKRLADALAVEVS